MNRFKAKQPAFLKAFERSNEKETSTLLTNSENDFFGDDDGLPIFQVTQESDQKSISKASTTTSSSSSVVSAKTKDDSLGLGFHFNTNEDPGLGILGNATQQTSICKTSRIISAGDKPFTSKDENHVIPRINLSTKDRPALRRCRSERLKNDFPNLSEKKQNLLLNQTVNFSPSRAKSKSLTNQSAHVSTSKFIPEVCETNEGSNSGDGESMCGEIETDFFPETTSNDKLETFLSSEIEMDDCSQSSASSCEMTRAPETKKQIERSTSLNTSAGKIPEMIPRGLNPSFDQYQNQKKGLSRLKLTRKKSESRIQQAKYKDKELEASMVRVNCGDGSETFAQFTIGVKNESGDIGIDKQKTNSNSCVSLQKDFSGNSINKGLNTSGGTGNKGQFSFEPNFKEAGDFPDHTEKSSKNMNKSKLLPKTKEKSQRNLTKITFPAGQEDIGFDRGVNEGFFPSASNLIDSDTTTPMHEVPKPLPDKKVRNSTLTSLEPIASTTKSESARSSYRKVEDNPVVRNTKKLVGSNNSSGQNTRQQKKMHKSLDTFLPSDLSSSPPEDRDVQPFFSDYRPGSNRTDHPEPFCAGRSPRDRAQALRSRASLTDSMDILDLVEQDSDQEISATFDVDKLKSCPSLTVEEKFSQAIAELRRSNVLIEEMARTIFRLENEVIMLRQRVAEVEDEI